MIDQKIKNLFGLALGKVIWSVIRGEMTDVGDGERALARQLSGAVAPMVASNIYVLLTHPSIDFDPESGTVMVEGAEPTKDNLCPVVEEAFRAMARPAASAA